MKQKLIYLRPGPIQSAEEMAVELGIKPHRFRELMEMVNKIAEEEGPRKTNSRTTNVSRGPKPTARLKAAAAKTKRGTGPGVHSRPRSST